MPVRVCNETRLPNKQMPVTLLDVTKDIGPEQEATEGIGHQSDEGRYEEAGRVSRHGSGAAFSVSIRRHL